MGLAFATRGWAEEAEPAEIEFEGPTKSELLPSESTTLRSLVDSLALVERDIDAKRQMLNETVSEEERSAIYQEMVVLQEKQRSLVRDFESVATGIDLSEFASAPSSGFNLAREMNEFLEPIVKELKAITEQPRVIDQLRNDLQTEERRLEMGQKATARLDSLIEATGDPAVEERLTATRASWSEKAAEAANRIAVLEYRLEEAESQRQSIVDTGRTALTSFFRSRGLNLILTLTTFFAVFFLLRFMQRYVERIGPRGKRKRRPFATRLLRLAFHVFTFVGALGAAMIVLYASGDWVLMGLAMILIIGLILAAKNTLPRFLEQARLVLNLGEVREGERLVYQGVPWKVESLGFFTTLVNPDLTGGYIRLPLRQLTNLISRPIADGELWFPCHAGDWVLLSDGTRGRVLTQTPEMVHLVLLGGTKISYPTAEFLSLSPKNLSANFRIKSTFGIDYKHLKIATSEIPSKLWKTLMTELVKLIDRTHLIDLKVEFKEAGPSSLDYEIIADFSGEVASKYEMLARVLQRIAVDACNENGWEIPFTQMTVHHKHPASASRSDEPAPAPEPKHLP